MVSQLDFHLVEPFESFQAAGLRVRALPTNHGEDCICYGCAPSFLTHIKAVADVCYEKSCVCPVFMAFQADFSTSFNLPVGIDACIVSRLGDARLHSTMNGLRVFLIKC
jgi:hypothetical protein